MKKKTIFCAAFVLGILGAVFTNSQTAKAYGGEGGGNCVTPGCTSGSIYCCVNGIGQVYYKLVP